MKRSQRTLWWTVYGVGSAAVLLALGWVTMRVVHLEREEAQARGQVKLQEQVRQALWRMDSWLAPRLAREGSRTWFEYESYYPQTMAYNRLLEPLSEEAVVLPSPLLHFTSEYLPLHFQYREGTGFTSPQVPSAVYLSRDTMGCSPVPANQTHATQLAIFSKRTSPADLMTAVGAAEVHLAASMDAADNASTAWVLPDATMRQQQTLAPVQVGVAPQAWAKMQEEAAYDLKSRRANVKAAQDVVVNEEQMNYSQANTGSAGAVSNPEQVQVGPLVPLWMGSPPDRLLLARRVTLNSENIVQGIVVDWPSLKKTLLERVADFMPGADLKPAPGGGDLDPAVAMASLPVLLVPPPSALSLATASSAPGFAGLGLMWLAALGALGTTGLALRSTIASAVQTSRFASSVTHELRTPLTTFRLYAEMLSDDMVRDPEQRRTYLNTLRDESGRLGFLVENVLTWSRVEEGRATVEQRRISAGELVSAAEPLLRRRCQEAGATFELQLTTDPIYTSADADRVRQVLFNLVDNACKYAGQGATVKLSSETQDKYLVLAVDDDGPGVATPLRKRIFGAFDRGTRGPGDSVRGLGLGLAISRELARSLGGDMQCTTSALGGARFELRLPLQA